MNTHSEEENKYEEKCWLKFENYNRSLFWSVEPILLELQLYLLHEMGLADFDKNHPK